MLPSPPRDSSDVLKHVGAMRRYRRDAILFEQGFAAEAVHLIEDGHIKLSRSEEDGSNVIVGFRFGGSLIGDAAALLAENYCVTAVAMSDSWVRQIPSVEFRRCIKADPDLSWRLHLLHSREIQQQVIRIAIIGGLPARGRLERFLAEVLESQGALSDGLPTRLVPPLKHRDLAAAVVTTPEHLSRLLKQLEQDGLIRREHGWLVALRPQALSRTRAGI